MTYAASPDPLVTRLATRCLASWEDFQSEGTLWATETGERYIFKDNGSEVLAVAHLDLACEMGVSFEHRDGIVTSGALDDRLGAFVILDVLPAMGITVDVLLTDDEEVCDSTAAHFVPPKEYNWMFSFDRRGTDVVMYQYETRKRRKLLKRHGFEVGCGSYSCIANLDFLGVTGFNFGVGYHNEHSHKCFARLSDTAEQVEKFGKLYADIKDTRLNWTYQPYRRGKSLNMGFHSDFYGYRRERNARCPICFDYHPGEECRWRRYASGFDEPEAVVCDYCRKPHHEDKMEFLYGSMACPECYAFHGGRSFHVT